MIEHTYSSEWKMLIARIFIIDDSNPMWDSIVDSTHLKSYSDLLFLYFILWENTFIKDYLVIILDSIWVNHCVLVVFFELIIFLLEIVEVVEEWEPGRKAFVTLIWFGGVNLASLTLLLLNVIIRRFDTKSVHYLNTILIHVSSLLVNFGFKFFILLFQLVKSFNYSERVVIN